jgi:hypothetical protein
MGLVACSRKQDAQQMELDRRLREICETRTISDQQLREAIELLDQGADPNQKESAGCLLEDLMTSWRLYNDKNHERLFIALLEHGADPNGNIDDGEMDPLLFWGLNLDLERALIKHGARVTIRSHGGHTAYDCVLKKGDPEEITLFQKALKEQQR